MKKQLYIHCCQSHWSGWEELIRGCFAAAMNVSHVDLLVNNNVLKPLIFDVM